MAAAHFTLNTGARVPSVGLGTYKAAPGVVTDVVGAAVKVLSYLHAHLPFSACLLTCMFCLLSALW
jgi:hypothetical protein